MNIMDTRTAIRFEVYFPELLLLIELIESDGTQDSDCRWPIPYGRIFRIRDRSEKVMFCEKKSNDVRVSACASFLTDGGDSNFFGSYPK